VIAGLTFETPLLLTGLLALPFLWLLLKAVPPSPLRQRFPAVSLLLGLGDKESQTERTPIWLLVLRCIAVALVILGAAGPTYAPNGTGERQTTPLLLLIDNSWAAAPDWAERVSLAEAEIARAGQEGREIAIVATSAPPDTLVWSDWNEARAVLEAMSPEPWLGGDVDHIEWLSQLKEPSETVWIADGLAGEWRSQILDLREAEGAVRVLAQPNSTFLIESVTVNDGNLRVAAQMRRSEVAMSRDLRVIGLDPAGLERSLSEATITFEAGDVFAEVDIPLPTEIRNRVTRVESAALPSAGAVFMVGDRLRRPKVALVAGGASREGADLLSPLHYLREALRPSADLFERPLAEVLPAGMDAILLADVADISGADAEQLLDWARDGGTLIRFAGPRLAARDPSMPTLDPLLPVRLRTGGRSIGGVMSWGAPKTLAPFESESPFFGLQVPEDIEITTQVVAQPDPDLSQRVLAALDDSTPLVTRKFEGSGQIVLFHVTANAEWSNLPLSGLFVDMLQRLAVGSGQGGEKQKPDAESQWRLQDALDGFGRVRTVDTALPVSGADLASDRIGPRVQPGIYEGVAGRFAVNVADGTGSLVPMQWPDWVVQLDSAEPTPLPIAPWLFLMAIGAVFADFLATLVISGRLGGLARRLLPVLLAMTVGLPLGERVYAQATDPQHLRSAAEVTLAYVLTGNAEVDRVSQEGLQGLSTVLTQRTAVEPAAPVGVDPEADELAFYPLLYWPITNGQSLPSRNGYEKLNRYLNSGGMILFDTGDGDIANFGVGTPEGNKLQAIAIGLEIPPLEPIAEDHVLSRAFYLLREFPGRHNGEVWVEVLRGDPTEDSAAVDGPFRDPNDGVTPVIIGGNDWARAWALDAAGFPIYPVGRGQAGARQRELAFRFGVNVVMHVLTGNYKADQVHVPALLDRLGE